MKLLSIGNSFSVDSQRYVREIAAADGIDIELGNLYIGGCSLETHVNNLRSGAPAYEYYENNVLLGQSSIETAVNDKAWDVITLQQASHSSGIADSYYPYITVLAEYVRSKIPDSKLFVNQTWAYEYNSTHPAFSNYHKDRREMHKKLTACYIEAAKSIGADILPVGNAIAAAREKPEFDPAKGGTQLSRDGFHLSLGLGRYMASAVWYEVLTGNDIRSNSFVPVTYCFTGRDAAGIPLLAPMPGTEPDEKLFRLAREICHEAAAAHSKMLDTAR